MITSTLTIRYLKEDNNRTGYVLIRGSLNTPKHGKQPAELFSFHTRVLRDRIVIPLTQEWRTWKMSISRKEFKGSLKFRKLKWSKDMFAFTPGHFYQKEDGKWVSIGTYLMPCADAIHAIVGSQYRRNQTYPATLYVRFD